MVYIGKIISWKRVIFIKMDTLVPPYATLLWVFLFGVLHVHGYRRHIMTQEIPATVLRTLSLECHTIDSRSSVELAILCGNHDSCLGMKTNRDLGIPGMLCSCPNATTWPGVTNMSIAPMPHLRTRQEVTWPGEWWWGQRFSWKTHNMIQHKLLRNSGTSSDVLFENMHYHNMTGLSRVSWLFFSLSYLLSTIFIHSSMINAFNEITSGDHWAQTQFRPKSIQTILT